jgi:hypothetical protein
MVGCDRSSRLMVVFQSAQETGVVMVVRGDRWGVRGAIGGVSQLTRHWSGLSEMLSASFPILCSRSILPLAGSAQRPCTRSWKLRVRVSSAQETLIVTVVEVSDGVARRSGDRVGGSSEGRSVLWQRLSWLRAIGGAIQLTRYGSGLAIAACAKF